MSEPRQQFSTGLARDAVYTILEVYSPAVHQTVVVEAMPAAAAAR
jgi:hypothetical protein